MRSHITCTYPYDNAIPQLLVAKNKNKMRNIHITSTNTHSLVSSLSSATHQHHSIRQIARRQTMLAMPSNTAVVTGYALKWSAYAMALTIVRMHPMRLSKHAMPLTMALTTELLVTIQSPQRFCWLPTTFFAVFYSYFPNSTHFANFYHIHLFHHFHHFPHFFFKFKHFFHPFWPRFSTQVLAC